MFIYISILILSILLRLIGFENIALGDEYYSIYVVKSANVSSIFMDAGNPPFYYLILKLENMFFNFDILGFKLTSLIFNILAVVFIWLILKTKFNIKIANLGAFFASINTIMVYYSQEIRCYSLVMMLSPLIFYFLFETIQKRKNFYYLIYALIGAVGINIHYYQFIFLFLNFIFGLIYLKNKKKDVIKFILTNLIIFISILPFLFFVSYKGAFLNNEFNTWLPEINFSLVLKQISFIFGGLLSFFLSIIFFIKIILNRKINYKRKLYLSYFIYIIIFSLLISVILSLAIKPMMLERYFCFLIPLFMAFLAITFTCFKKKTYIIFFIIWIISIQYNTKITDYRAIYRLEHKIFDIVENNENNYVIVRNVTKFYIKTLDNFDKVNVFSFDTLDKIELQKNVKNKISEILKNNQNAVIYTDLLNHENNNPKALYFCYYNKKSDTCLWKITGK